MHIVILGNGISGVTAARFIRKRSDYKITLISGESDSFFSRTALMYIYMGHMRLEDTQPYEPFFWEKNRINRLKAWIERVDFTQKRLYGSGGKVVQYDKLILALGSAPNKFGWPGQDLDRVGGLYTLQDLEAMEKGSKDLKRAVIVGGGLIGIEMGEMFHSRQIPVTFLVRESSYWNHILPKKESEMINRHILEHGFDLRLSTELKSIESDGEGRACGITTNTGETIACGYVGLTAGVHPNIGFLATTELEIQKGILVNEYLQTNLPDVFAVGDCAQLSAPKPGRRPIEAIWYTGRMMGEVAAYNVTGDSVAYDPGIWFNSAKFLDIEYQVYGDVRAVSPEEHQSVYWEHKDGRKSIRLVYHRDEGHILGFNLMGIRYRHEVCEKWLAEKTPIASVITQLGIANFDPEFFRQYEKDIVEAYNQQTGSALSLHKKRGLKGALQFLNRTI